MTKSQGSGRLTQAEIGRRLGVSQTLVGYALNGSGRISTELRDRIVAEAKRLGYTPNKAARALKSGRSHLVAVCLPQGMPPFFGLILEELQRLAELDGYDLVTTSGRMPQFSQWPLDGVLVFDNAPSTAGQLQSAVVPEGKPSVPTVVFGHRLYLLEESPLYSQIDYVGFDLLDASREAVRGLIAMGCQKLAFMAADVIINAYEPRQRAFLEIIEEAGIEGIEIQVPFSATLRQESKRVLLESLQSGVQFDGLFCGNDDVALGALRALHSAGLRVPDDVKVIGCDGLPDTADAEPPLSTIVLPVKELCQEAWSTLLWRLQNPDEPLRREALNSRIIWRESAPAV